jgi:ubiquinone/menaquinone biosynthesis C-methylase UbiE
MMKLYEYRRNYELEQNYWWFVGVHTMVKSLLALSIRHKSLGKVLDVGCGTGVLLDHLQAYSEELWGVDISQEALKYCLLRDHKNLILSDAINTAFPEEYFDVITAIGIIEHLEDDHAFLLEMKRLLKSNGIMILLTSSFPYLWSMHDTANEHKRRYYLRPLNRKINEIGFETIRFSHLNFFLFPIIAFMLLSHRLIYGIESDHPQRILPNTLPIINFMLTRLLILESKLMRWIRLPWGISMIGAFRKLPCES